MLELKLRNKETGKVETLTEVDGQITVPPGTWEPVESPVVMERVFIDPAKALVIVGEDS